LKPIGQKAASGLAAHELNADDIEKFAEAAVEQHLLDQRIDELARQRDTALVLIGTPPVTAIVGMNDATYMLIGERSKYALRLNELLGDVLETVADLYVPGTAVFIMLFKQFRNRIRQSAAETANALVLTQRLFYFGDCARESRVALDGWHQSAISSLGILDNIATTEFPAVIERIRELQKM